MGFFKSKKSLKKQRELSPIGRLIMSGTNTAQQITKAISKEDLSDTRQMRSDSDLTKVSQEENVGKISSKRSGVEAVIDDGLSVMPSSSSNGNNNRLKPREPNSRSVSFNSDSYEKEPKENNLDEPTKRYISDLHQEISMLKEENINITTEHQCACERYESEINELNEQNTNLKTQLNSFSQTQERDRDRGSGIGMGSTLASSNSDIKEEQEKLTNIVRILEAQILDFQDRYSISPKSAQENNKVLPKKLRDLKPNWVINFEDMGPLVESYDIRLKSAHKAIYDAKNETDITHFENNQKDLEIQKLLEELESKEKTNENLQAHLSNLSNKMTQQVEDFNLKTQNSYIKKSDHNEIINDTKEKLEHEMNQKIKILEDENDKEINDISNNFENEKQIIEKKLKHKTDENSKLIEDLESYKLANNQLEKDISNLNIKIDVSTKTNAKYIVSMDQLINKSETLAQDLAVSKAKEQEWKLHTKKSVDLLEKAIEERDIYHLLAAREHENCRYAINSASGLKLQHLKQGFFLS